MNRQLKGIALILFGILMLIFSIIDPWIPIIDSAFSTIALWGGLLLGIVGLVIALKNDSNEKK